MLLPLGRAVPTEKPVGYSQTTFLAPCDGVGTEKGCRNPLKHSSALQGCHERAKASGKNRPHTHLAVHSEPRACIKVQLIQGRNAGLGSGPARQLGRTRPELWAGAVCPRPRSPCSQSLLLHMGESWGTLRTSKLSPAVAVGLLLSAGT